MNMRSKDKVYISMGSNVVYSAEKLQKMLYANMCRGVKSVPPWVNRVKVQIVMISSEATDISINWSKNAWDWSINSRPDPLLSSPCPRLVLLLWLHCPLGERVVSMHLFYSPFATHTLSTWTRHWKNSKLKRPQESWCSCYQRPDWSCCIWKRKQGETRALSRQKSTT